MKKPKEKKEEEKKEEFITKEYFEEQFGKLLNLVEKIAEPKSVEKPEDIAAAQVSRTPVPPEWNLYIDSHLGKEIGRSVFYPKSGTGFILQMSIPKELSNAPEDHWNYYHHDFRTKAIDPREGFEGVKTYVDLVAKNLKLDLRMVSERNAKIALK